MKKKIPLICMVAVVIVLAGSGAWAFQYTQIIPTDQVAGYQGGSVTYPAHPTWYTQIGDSNFTIGGANVVTSGGQTYLDIFTGWGAGTSSPATFTELGAIAADLTITAGGSTWMVRLDNTQGKEGYLFSSPTYYTSYNVYGSANGTTGNSKTLITNYSTSGLTYGGAYNSSTTPNIAVWATSTGTPGKTGFVTWYPSGTGSGHSGYTNYSEVVVDLSDISSLGFPTGFSFLYASGTCANSVLTGCYNQPVTGVPLPPSALLLGSGLLGLGLLGRKKRKP